MEMFFCFPVNYRKKKRNRSFCYNFIMTEISVGHKSAFILQLCMMWDQLAREKKTLSLLCSLKLHQKLLTKQHVSLFVVFFAASLSLCKINDAIHGMKAFIILFIKKQSKLLFNFFLFVKSTTTNVDHNKLKIDLMHVRLQIKFQKHFQFVPRSFSRLAAKCSS